MKIRVYKRIRDNVYDVLVRTCEWAQSDIALFREFGEPEIDVGRDGHAKFAKVMTGFPVFGSFYEGECNDAESNAEAWKDDVVAKVKAAVEAQRQLKDGFSGEEVHMV